MALRSRFFGLTRTTPTPFIPGRTGGLLDGLGDRVQDQVMDAPRATSAAGARRGTAVGYRLLDIHLHSFMM